MVYQRSLQSKLLHCEKLYTTEGIITLQKTQERGSRSPLNDILEFPPRFIAEGKDEADIVNFIFFSEFFQQNLFSLNVMFEVPLCWKLNRFRAKNSQKKL